MTLRSLGPKHNNIHIDRQGGCFRSIMLQWNLLVMRGIWKYLTQNLPATEKPTNLEVPLVSWKIYWKRQEYKSGKCGRDPEPHSCKWSQGRSFRGCYPIHMHIFTKGTTLWTRAVWRCFCLPDSAVWGCDVSHTVSTFYRFLSWTAVDATFSTGKRSVCSIFD